MEIVWSKLAYEHFLEILIYVENNFGMLTAQKTRQKIQDKVNLLAKHPYIGIIDSDFSTLFNNITVRRNYSANRIQSGWSATILE